MRNDEKDEKIEIDEVSVTDRISGIDGISEINGMEKKKNEIVRSESWLADYLEKQIVSVRKTVGGESILLALSGGVDSSVCASLLSKAVPGQLVCIFVDHGLMRLNEADSIERVFSGKNLKFIRINAKDKFLSKLCGITEPEQKRKIIGAEFASVFEEEASRLNLKYLAQGTIYADIIESGSNQSTVIKSHHNVGGLPKNLKFEGVIEPLAGLIKDEVRAIGVMLGLPAEIVQRQPFPGPGLGVRIMGEITEEKLDILRHADHILREEIENSPGQLPQQYFAVLTDMKSVGVKDGRRTYDYVIALRAVTTGDFFTCEYSRIPHETLSRISSRITNEAPRVGRVVYDITSKPPATIEWE